MTSEYWTALKWDYVRFAIVHIEWIASLEHQRMLCQSRGKAVSKLNLSIFHQWETDISRYFINVKRIVKFSVCQSATVQASSRQTQLPSVVSTKRTEYNYSDIPYQKEVLGRKTKATIQRNNDPNYCGLGVFRQFYTSKRT